MFRSDFLTVLQERGFLNDCTNLEGLDAHLASGTRTGYIGFDATAPSLHVGSLIPLMMLHWFERTGHTPIALMGGGTTMVGDPSFRQDSRPMLSTQAIADNIASLETVLDRVIDPAKSLRVNNADWLGSLNLLSFLRDIGSHFTINKMLAFDSVKSRLEAHEPLSFLEFNYMLLQAFDFLALHDSHECALQMGGSDQWGNIINGIDLIRRARQKESFGLTAPLLTTASGAKMGKTAQGAVWLNANMLDPFDFWQFWRNVDDQDVGRFLKLFTDIPVAECDRLGALQGSEINEAKIVLATAITALLHGQEAATVSAAAAAQKGQSQTGLPELAFTGQTLTALFVESGLCSSGRDAKRSLQEGALKIDGTRLTSLDETPERPFVLSKGKKKHVRIL